MHLSRKQNVVVAVLSFVLAAMILPQRDIFIQPVRAASEVKTTQLPITKSISRDALKKHEQVSVDVEMDGKKVTFTGVPLRVMLSEMMPELNLADMPGWKALAKQELVLEVSGADGFPGLVTGTEVAMNKSGDRFLLAIDRDGKAIESGVQLICRADEAHTRWVHEVVSLRIVSLATK